MHAISFASGRPVRYNEGMEETTNTTKEHTMTDHEIDIREYRDAMEADLAKWQEAIAEGEDDEAVEEAEAELEVFSLDATIRHRFQVTLAVQGPTVWLEADVAGEPGQWERTGEITLHHSWGRGQKDIPVWGDSALATYFDDALQCA